MRLMKVGIVFLSNRKSCSYFVNIEIDYLRYFASSFALKIV